MRRFRTPAALLALALATACIGCNSEAKDGPPIPASSDPAGKDLLPGAIVAAEEKGAAVKQEGIRLYKVIDTVFFPPPMSDELVMIAYKETSPDFRSASALWAHGKLTVGLPQVRVQRHLFRVRDYRVLANEPVTEADKAAKADEPRKK
jgi:hypothetical protein